MSKDDAEAPLEWCQRMIDNAADGETAMDYFRLKELWAEILKPKENRKRE